MYVKRKGTDSCIQEDIDESYLSLISFSFKSPPPTTLKFPYDIFMGALPSARFIPSPDHPAECKNQKARWNVNGSMHSILSAEKAFVSELHNFQGTRRKSQKERGGISRVSLSSVHDIDAARAHNKDCYK